MLSRNVRSAVILKSDPVSFRVQVRRVVKWAITLGILMLKRQMLWWNLLCPSVGREHDSVDGQSNEHTGKLSCDVTGPYLGANLNKATPRAEQRWGSSLLLDTTSEKRLFNLMQPWSSDTDVVSSTVKTLVCNKCDGIWYAIRRYGCFHNILRQNY